MDLGIRGRRALVGGASSGLGRAVAERLAAEGCDLAISARRADVLQGIAADLAARHGIRAVALPADLTDPSAPAALAAAALEALGGIDIVVLNAGGPPPVDPTATDAAGWALAFRLLATSPIELATALLPGMRERGWGRVVAIGSYAIRQPIENLVYSNAARSALVAWLKTVAGVVAADGVTVNGALPGRHATPRIEQLDRVDRRADRSVDRGGPGSPYRLDSGPPLRAPRGVRGLRRLALLRAGRLPDRDVHLDRRRDRHRTAVARALRRHRRVVGCGPRILGPMASGASPRSSEGTRSGPRLRLALAPPRAGSVTSGCGAIAALSAAVLSRRRASRSGARTR